MANQQKNNTIRPVYIPPTKNRAFRPPYKPDQDKIRNMFTIITEGDINKIKSAISEYNMSLNIRDDQNKSPIHYILDNNSSNLTENQKYEIIQLLINNGSSVSAPDIYNTTPLHLAAKYQYKNIVELLLQNHANPNVIDNFGMTPLHYSVQGNLELCKETKKIGKLISLNPTKLITNPKSLKQLKNLTIKIIDILNTNYFQLYLLNIKNTINNVNNIYNADFTNQNDIFLKQITNKLSSNTNNISKDQFTKNEILSLTSSLDKLVINNLKKTLQESTSNTNYIPTISPPIFTHNNLSTQVNQLNDQINYINFNIFKLTQINANSIINNLPTNFNLQNYILSNNTDSIYYQEFDLSGPVPTNLINFDTNIYQILLFRGTPDEINDWTTKKIRSKAYPLTNDNNFNLINNTVSKSNNINNTPITGPIINFDNTIDLTHSPDIFIYKPDNIKPYYTKTSEPYINSPYYFTTKLTFYTKQIINHLVSKSNLENTLNLYLDKEYYYEIYQNILPNLLLLSYDIYQNMLAIEEEKTKVINILNNIKNNFEINILNNSNNSYLYLLINCSLICSNIIENITTISKLNNILYTDISKSILNYNNIIKNINKKSAISIIQNLINTDFQNNNFNLLSNIFDQKLDIFILPPKNLIEYKNIDKSNFYKLYIPSITNQNYILNNFNISPPYPKFNNSNNTQTFPTNTPPILTNFTPGLLIPQIDNLPIGNLGVINFDFPKINPVPNSINFYLDDYLNNIKILLINKVLEEFNTNYIDDKTNYLNSINFPIIKEEIFSTTITKITDELIILQIKNQIYNKVNNYVQNLYNEDFKNSNIISDIKFTSKTDFSLYLNEVYSDITQNYNKYPIQNLNLVEKIDNTKSPDQYQIYDNSLSTINNNTKLCYKINDKIITLLISYGANPNKKDSSGSTPIFYALKNLNLNSVKNLITNNSNIYDLKNNNNITGYNYFINIYKEHIYLLTGNKKNISEILKNFTDPLYKSLKNEIEATSEFSNNIILYTDVIFPQLIIMFNNLLYFYTKSYINNYNFNNYQNLKNLFLKFDPKLNLADIIPLINNIDRNTLNNSIKLSNIDEDFTDNKNTLLSNQNYINKLKNTKTSLEQEGNLDQVNIINDKINKLENKNRKISDNNTNLNNYINDQNNKLYDSISENIKDFKINKQNDNLYDNIFQQVSKIYNQIFNNIISNQNQYSGYEDYFLYNSLWENLINDSDKMNSIYNIHLVSSFVQSQYINNTNKLNITDLDILYKKVFNISIQNMFDLPQEYNITENYMLFEVLNIIKHVVKHILCSNLYYAVIKTVNKYLVTVNLNNSNIDNQNLIDQVINSNNVPELHNYILNELPKILVKQKLNIYADEYDEQQNLDKDDIFEKITNIISTNTIGINVDSQLIDNLRKYVYEYYNSMFVLIIPKMKTLLDNYCRYILNDGKYIDILAFLISKKI
jgi:hypothetical protein